MFAQGRQGAEDVVRFIALAGDDGVAHAFEQLFDQRQLLGKLLGHSLALRFVAVEHLVAEGGRF